MRWLTTTSRSAPTAVVEVAAVLDAEALGHRDLDRLDVVPVPDRLQHRVGEPEVEQLLQAHLAEEVVDPVQPRLVDVLVQLVGEGRARRPGRGRTASPRRPGRSGSGRPRRALDHGAEQERRDLQVEDGRRGALDGRARRAGTWPASVKSPGRRTGARRTGRTHQGRRPRRSPRSPRRRACEGRPGSSGPPPRRRSGS